MEPAQTMSRLALRDHAAQILLAIAKDLRQPQTEDERHIKSQGLAKSDSSETSAATHGVLRQLVGFDLVQLAAEYRAVRATVLRLWKQAAQGYRCRCRRRRRSIQRGGRSGPCRIDCKLLGACRSFARYVSRGARPRSKKPVVGNHVSTRTARRQPIARPAARSSAADCETKRRIDAPDDHRPARVHANKIGTWYRDCCGSWRFFESLSRRG